MKIEGTFCFFDLAGFSALTEAHGDDAAADLSHRFTEIVAASRSDGDRIVKTIGDAVLLTSRTPKAAVELVARFWDGLAEEPDFPQVRAGLHHGEAVKREGDVYGAAVNLCARIASQAGGGEVLASNAVARAAEDLGIPVTSLGPVRLRNIRDPIELNSLDFGHPTSVETLDPVCRMRVHPRSAAGQLHFRDKTYWFCSLNCASLFASTPEAYVQDRD